MSTLINALWEVKRRVKFEAKVLFYYLPKDLYRRAMLHAAMRNNSPD